MDTLLFAGALLCLIVVAAWYVANEAAGAAGDKSLLALRTEKDEGAVETYREKAAPSFRPARRAARYRTR
ncbi:MAG: hypothetical protein AB7P23_01015 [Amphiplicatus sp.]